MSKQLAGLVTETLFRTALDGITPFHRRGTRLGWVNWRKDQCQIKITWHGREALACYLNFFSFAERDAVHKALFDRFAGQGTKPFVEQGHGWTKLRHDFFTPDTLTINQLAKIADDMGVEYTVIYVQEDIRVRPLFGRMGIPLVPGEMGKELINGEMISYSRATGKCL